jgi:glucose-6-phosphate isomerase
MLGGRYSVTSAVGVVPLALHYGMPIVQDFLAGANNIDEHVKRDPESIPVIMGLLGVWNSTFLGYESRALLPYR